MWVPLCSVGYEYLQVRGVYSVWIVRVSDTSPQL